MWSNDNNKIIIIEKSKFLYRINQFPNEAVISLNCCFGVNYHHYVLSFHYFYIKCLHHNVLGWEQEADNGTSKCQRCQSVNVTITISHACNCTLYLQVVSKIRVRHDGHCCLDMQLKPTPSPPHCSTASFNN